MESLGGDFQIYENSGYRNERQKKQTLVIDLQGSSDLTPTTGDATLRRTTFTVDLQEPFIIDSLCDVYLDNFTTLNAIANTAAINTAFVVDIDQFQIKTNTNNAELLHKLVIPNEDNSVAATATLKVHKGKKMNYVCQMNPQTLTQLSGSVTAMNGTTMESGTGDYRVIMECVFVSRE